MKQLPPPALSPDPSSEPKMEKYIIYKHSNFRLNRNRSLFLACLFLLGNLSVTLPIFGDGAADMVEVIRRLAGADVHTLGIREHCKRSDSPEIGLGALWQVMLNDSDASKQKWADRALAEISIGLLPLHDKLGLQDGQWNESLSAFFQRKLQSSNSELETRAATIYLGQHDWPTSRKFCKRNGIAIREVDAHPESL